jgi:arabinosaccharide transport system substrate-binding protein
VDKHDDVRLEQPKAGISRRSLLGAGAGAAGALALSGTARRSSAAPRIASRYQADAELEMWGFDAQRLNFAKAAAELPVFKDKYPNVTINFREFPFNEMHDKLLAALASGQGAPDIADVEIGRFSQYLKGERVGFVPLNDRIGSEIENVYKPAAVDPWSFGGQIYGVGNELNAVVLAYRVDVVEAAGGEHPFDTWDQVIEVGKKIAADGETKTFALHDLAWGDFFQMIQHAGSSFFDAEGNYQADGPLGVEALTFLHDLIYTHEVAAIAPALANDDWMPPVYWAAFKANKFTMLWGPPWHIGRIMIDLPEQSGKWALQKLPTGLGESKATANFGGTGQCITEQSEYADIAWDLIAAGNLTAEGNLNDFTARTVYPAYIPTYERPELQEPSEYFGGAQVGQLYASVAPDLPPFYQSPSFFDATDALERVVITPVMNDEKQPEEALKELREELED